MCYTEIDSVIINLQISNFILIQKMQHIIAVQNNSSYILKNDCHLADFSF